jgi:hypothetical protein
MRKGIIGGAAAFTAVVAVALPGSTALAQSAGYELLVSSTPDRGSPAPLQGRTVSGNVHVFVSPESGVVQVRFYLDDPNRTRSPRKVEKNAPWDFAGSAEDRSALPFDASTLSAGTHTITAAIDRSGGGTTVITSSFTVDNIRPPDQVHLAWVGDPSRTLDVIWRTRDNSTPSVVEYRQAGETSWRSASGGLRPSGTSGTLHEVQLTSLLPSTAYEYRVRGDGGRWSQVFTTRTAPPPGPADFDAVYVADTGLIGRLDGLATGTSQVINEIAALNPLLVLGGGDYAYYSTDKRFGSLDNTIDAWFNQMEPVAAQSPLMPAYGNHEALLEERFEDWAPRFATPTGFDSRRNYSFDVGDVHFISVFAVEDFGGLRNGTLTWLETDINAAKARGQRWIIPYLHVAPFADGKNHPSNLALRAQLGPLFERLGVKLVITSHDQAYERTWPLVDVPDTNTPTSQALDCYTLADGVTWVKVSPGGKLSNKNGNFSQFANPTAPSWTAVRDNTMHHFARLRVSAAGVLQLDVYGVKGDGSPPVIQDSFRYTTGTCPNRLTFSPPQASFAVEEGGTAAPQQVRLDGTGTGPAAYTVTDDASWLSVSPASGSTPRDLTLSVNSTGLQPGLYRAVVTATAAGHGPATLNVTLTVSGGFELAVSSSSGRTAAEPLAGRTVAGNIYVFARPETGASRASFWLDNPTMSATPRRIENTAPWDFAGGTVTTASPFDTRTISEGSHTITVALDTTTGTREVVHATFTVANQTAPPPTPLHRLLISTSADRASPSLVDGATVSGNIYVFTDPESDTTRVRFWLDNPQRAGSPRKVESNAPWDFAGTETNRNAIPFNTRSVANGSHVITAEITRGNGAVEIVNGIFTVANAT